MSTLDNNDKRHLQVGLRNNRIGAKVFDFLDDVEDAGVVASSRLVLSDQPTATDTIGIGSDTYEFVATGGNVADDAYIAVEIGGDAGETRDNLIAAINATDPDNEHPNINNVADDAPAKSNGTEAVVADEVGTSVRVRSADVAGGNALAADPSIVLAESITAAADIWITGDVNLNTLAGRAQRNSRATLAKVAITAAMITNGLYIDLPFTPDRFTVQVQDSSGVVRGHGADAFVINGDVLEVTFNGGADPDIQATDTLLIQAWS